MGAMVSRLKGASWSTEETRLSPYREKIEIERLPKKYIECFFGSEPRAFSVLLKAHG
jgi:hypothetical protein